MEKTNLLTLVVTLTVGIILAGSLLMPVLSDATTTEKTFTNTGGFYPMTELNASDSTPYTISWSEDNLGKLIINDVEFDANAAYGAWATSVLASEDWTVRYWPSKTSGEYIQLFDGTTWVSSVGFKSFEITAASGTVTITRVNSSDVSSTATDTYTKLYAIDTSIAEDIMKKPTETPYVLGDTEIYAMGITTVSGDLHLIKVEGSINDGIEVSVLGVDGAVVSNITVDSEPIQGYNSLYKISKITFTVDYDGATTDCTYNYFIVPYEVTAELSQHLNAGEIALLNALPILVIIGLVMAGVGAIFIRNRD